MRHERPQDDHRDKPATEPEDPTVSEFARRHQISRAVAKAVLANAKTPADADAAVVKMRGTMTPRRTSH
jgi:hypothetical protein